ncbi:MAG: hypothetical protein GXP13_02050 [Gammaproteobacteria bacterium]|nr:hypothetical protein [Gammaproteobacteria bacterium]
MLFVKNQQSPQKKSRLLVLTMPLVLLLALVSNTVHADEYDVALERTKARLIEKLLSLNFYKQESLLDFSYGYPDVSIKKSFPGTYSSPLENTLGESPELEFSVNRVRINILTNIESKEKSWLESFKRDGYGNPDVAFSRHKDHTKNSTFYFWNGNKITATPYSYSVKGSLKEKDYNGISASMFISKIIGKEERMESWLYPPQAFTPPKRENTTSIFQDAYLLVNNVTKLIDADRLNTVNAFFEYPLGGQSNDENTPSVGLSLTFTNFKHRQPDVPMIDEELVDRIMLIATQIVQEEFRDIKFSGGTAGYSNGSGEKPDNQISLPDPKTTAATAAAIAAILIAAGIAVQIATSIAAAIAQAIQAGVEFTADEIGDAVAEGLANASSSAETGEDPEIPEPKPPPLYDPSDNNSEIEYKDGQYWIPEKDPETGEEYLTGVSRQEAEKYVEKWRREMDRQHRNREIEIQHHDQETDKIREKWRSDTQERHAAERAQEFAEKEELRAAREKIQRQAEEELSPADEAPSIEELIEATPGIDNTGIGWGINLAKGFFRGSVDDGIELITDTPGALIDAVASAAVSAAKILAKPENWRIAGETAVETLKDLNAPMSGDFGRTVKVMKNVGDGGLVVGKVAVHLVKEAWKEPAGAAVAISKAVLGVDNWEKAIDPDVPVTERMGRAMWGAIDTGGVFVSAGATALKGASKFGSLIRIADTTGDAIKGAKALDAAADAAKAIDAAGDAVKAAKAADTAGDVAGVAKGADKAADITKSVDAAGDATKSAKAADTAGDAAKGTKSTTTANSARRETIDEMRERLANQRRGPVNTPEGAAARRDGIPDMATDPEGYVSELPSGALVDRNLANGTGYTGAQIDDMARFAKDEDVIIGTRSTNVDSMRHIRDGKAVPKPLTIKSKTISEADTYLGVKTEDKGLVGYFKPKNPDPDKVPEHLWNKVNERYDARLKDYVENRESVTKLVTEGSVVEKNGKLHAVIHKADGTTELKPFAGDIDGVYFKDATSGKMVPPGERYEKLKAAWRGDTTKGGPDYWAKSGAPGQHGVETNLVADVTSLYKPGTPEYEKALGKAQELHASLAANHWKNGGETVLTMSPDGHLRRGIRFTKESPLPELAGLK